MSLLDRYPTLRNLRDELAGLSAGEAPPPGQRRRMRLGEGRDLVRVEWPGLPRFWVTPPQRAVVEVLLDAYLHSRSPDVSQERLLRASGVEGARRLSDVFGRNPALGELIVPGKTPGTFRLAELPEAPDEEGETEE